MIELLKLASVSHISEHLFSVLTRLLLQSRLQKKSLASYILHSTIFSSIRRFFEQSGKRLSHQTLLVIKALTFIKTLLLTIMDEDTQPLYALPKEATDSVICIEI